MTSAAYRHPAMDDVDTENGMVVSVYQGVRIPTGRGHPKKLKFGFGDLDPTNTKLYDLINGDLDLSELDNEEITFGIPKCDDGFFSAKAAWQAAKLPQRIKVKFHKELYKRANNGLHSGLLGAIESIVEMATSPHVEDATRFRAATYLFERLQGKMPEVIVHSQEAPWEVVLSGVRRGPRKAREIDDGNMQDAEVVEE